MHMIDSLGVFLAKTDVSAQAALMDMDGLWASLTVVLAIVFAASLVRSVFGFADALIAMPLLWETVGPHTARPLVALVSLTIACVILFWDWKHVHFASAWRLIVGSLTGVPIGFFFLAVIPDSVGKLILGCVIVGFVAYHLGRPTRVALKSDNLSIVFGLIAGMLGGAFNTPGPPVAIYGTLRRWPAAEFRATFQGYALPTALAIAVGHGLNGLITPTILLLYVACLSVVAVAIPLGGWINRRLKANRFTRVIHLLLLVIGGFLLVRSIAALLNG